MIVNPKVSFKTIKIFHGFFKFNKIIYLTFYKNMLIIKFIIFYFIKLIYSNEVFYF